MIRALRGLRGAAAYRFVLRDWAPLFDHAASAQVLETKRFTQNLVPQVSPGPAGRRILSFAPHPDDDAFGAGGTLLRAARRGVEVRSLCCTDASPEPATARTIEEETRAVAKAMGAEVEFLRYPLRRIPRREPRLEAALRRAFEGFRPEALFLPFLLDDHDDHRRVNQLLLDASTRVDLGAPEVWAYQVYSTVLPNVAVDITEHAEAKRDLIRTWQHLPGERDWAHYVLGRNAADCRYVPSPRKEPRYAEVFFVVPLHEYLDLCRRYFARPAGEVYYTPDYRAEEAGA